MSLHRTARARKPRTSRSLPPLQLNTLGRSRTRCIHQQCFVRARNRLHRIARGCTRDSVVEHLSCMGTCLAGRLPNKRSLNPNRSPKMVWPLGKCTESFARYFCHTESWLRRSPSCGNAGLSIYSQFCCKQVPIVSAARHCQCCPWLLQPAATCSSPACGKTGVITAAAGVGNLQRSTCAATTAGTVFEELVPVVWSVIGTCQIHRDIAMGEQVAHSWQARVVRPRWWL